MEFEPMPAYFLVKIAIREQKDKKEKVGSILIPETIVFQTRNMQAGEIVAIGKDAARLFPQAKIGHILLLHWSVENPDKFQIIDSDENFNYYVVTSCEHNGQANQSYGVWDGEKIIPSPEYIFLEPPPTGDNSLIKSKGGLLLFSEWKLTREEKEEKMAVLKEQIQSLCKTERTQEINRAIQKKEDEISRISADINSKRIEFYTLAAINPDYAEAIEKSYGEYPVAGTKMAILNIAAQTTIEFQEKTYIVSLVRHCYGTKSWYDSGIASYKKTCVETQVAG